MYSWLPPFVGRFSLLLLVLHCVVSWFGLELDIGDTGCSSCLCGFTCLLEFFLQAAAYLIGRALHVSRLDTAVCNSPILFYRFTMAFNLGNILYFAVLSGFLANAYAAITMLPDGSGNGYTVEPRQFLWIVVLEVIVTFTTAFGIGANDCANSFGTSLGSGALTLRCVRHIVQFSL